MHEASLHSKYCSLLIEVAFIFTRLEHCHLPSYFCEQSATPEKLKSPNASSVNYGDRGIDISHSGC